MSNVLIIHGTTVAPPDLSYTGDGVAVCTLRVQTTHTRRVANGDVKEEVTVFETLIFGAMAEHVSESVLPGDAVVVTGRLRNRTHTEQGANRAPFSYEVVADDVAASVRAGSVIPIRATPHPVRTHIGDDT